MERIMEYTTTNVIETLDKLLWLNDMDKRHWFRKRLNQCRTEKGYQALAKEVTGKLAKVLH